MHNIPIKRATYTIIILLLFSLSGCSEVNESSNSNLIKATARKSTPVNIEARETAKEAYYQIAGNVFNRSQIKEGVGKMAEAYRLDPEEPWVYLTASLATLVYGYKIGDWYMSKTFTDGTVDKSIELADQALILGPDLSQAHSHYARLLIIKKKYSKALRHLESAQELDPQDFYPNYFKGVLFENMGEYEEAILNFAEAEAKISYEYQHGILSFHRQYVARKRGDFTEQERLLKENIARKPEYPYYHSHYAFFLKKHGRLDEAIEQWEMAVEFGPYPNAVTQLKKAKKLRAQQELYR